MYLAIPFIAHRTYELLMIIRSVCAIIFQLFKLIVLEKRVLTILELNWNQRLGHKKTKLNICHICSRRFRSIHVVERTRTSLKCQKMRNARAKRAKILFLLSNMQICEVFVAVVVVVASEEMSAKTERKYRFLKTSFFSSNYAVQLKSSLITPTRRRHERLKFAYLITEKKTQ